MKDEALKYLRAGFSVIPLGQITITNNGKDKDITYPISWKQFQTRHATEEEVANWNYPNLGIVTGQISNLIVLDADTYKENFNKDLFKSLNIPVTPCQKTGRGGTQYFFRRDDIEIRNSVNIGENSGIDIRADGGMVIVAPSSTIGGGEYGWIIDPFDTPLAPLPESLKSLITHDLHTKRSKPLSSVVNLKEGEGRDNALTSLVGRLCMSINPDKWDSEIPPVMQAINDTYNPPLPKEDLDRIFNSITGKEARRRILAPEIKVDNVTTPTPIVEQDINDSLSFADFITKEYPRAKFALEPFFELETVNMLSAPPNNWKSWFLFYISACIARGEMAFSKHSTTQMGVLIVNEEDSARAIQDRYKALSITDRSLPIHLHIAKGLKIDKFFVAKIIKEMEEKDLKLLIIDSLRAVHTSNENDSAEMQVVLDHLKEFARAGITVLFTHHNRKKSMTDKGDMAESTRGSSAINAAISGHVSLEERVGETGTFLVVRHLKSKAVEKIQPFELQIKKNNGQISFEYVGEFEEGEKKVLEAMDSIMNVLANEKYETINHLAKIGVASSTVVREAMKKLSEKSLVGRISRAEAKKKGIHIPTEGKANENLFFLIEHRQINKDVELEMYTQQFYD